MLLFYFQMYIDAAVIIETQNSVTHPFDLFIIMHFINQQLVTTIMQKFMGLFL
jgi:hypothetical protein